MSAGMLGPAISGGFGGAAGGGLMAALGGPLGIGLGLASSVLPGLLGGGAQIAAPAPAFQPGPSVGVAGTQPNQAPPPIQSQPMLPITQSMSGLPDFFKSGSTPDSALDDPTGMEDGQDKKKFGLDDFIGGIDKGLQSPAQLLGLGLLGQAGQNTRIPLPLLGLLGMGLFNKPGQ